MTYSGSLQVEDFQRPAIALSSAAGGLLPVGCGGAAWDAPRAVPLERWDVDGMAKAEGGAHDARFGAFVDAAQLFDASAFNTSRCTSLLKIISLTYA